MLYSTIRQGKYHTLIVSNVAGTIHWRILFDCGYLSHRNDQDYKPSLLALGCPDLLDRSIPDSRDQMVHSYHSLDSTCQPCTPHSQ